MSDRDITKQEIAGHPLVRSEKRIIGHEEGNDPELEPLFANHFEVFQIGSDIYLDIGIVRPADFLNLREEIQQAPEEIHSIPFHVLQRIAMSQDGLQRLKAGLESLTKSAQGGPIAD